jgi:hypothetical protein
MATQYKGNALRRHMQEYLKGWRKERKDILYKLVFAIISLQTIVLTKLALKIGGTAAKVDSRYKQISRFLGCDNLDWTGWIPMIIMLCGVKGKLTFLLDRTDWKFGSKHFNLLVYSILTERGSIPIAVKDLDQRGNSSSKARIDLLNQIGEHIGWDRIEWLIADREFIGKEWWSFLRRHKIHLCIRIKESTRIGPVKEMVPLKQIKLIKDLEINQSITLSGKREIYGQKVIVIAMKILNDKGKPEYVIIASTKSGQQALERYRKRWNIESMFKHNKTDGFNLEDTHLKSTQKMEVLFRIMGLAYLLTIETGALIEQLLPVKMLKHGYRSKSLFKKGLEIIIQILDETKISLNKLLTVLLTTQRRRDLQPFYSKLLSYS